MKDLLTSPGTDNRLRLGHTDPVQLFDDRRGIEYDVIDGVPILMPSVLPPSAQRTSGAERILSDIASYSEDGTTGPSATTLARDLRRLEALDRQLATQGFSDGRPVPSVAWDNPFDGAATRDCYRHLFDYGGPPTTVCQLGGRGLHGIQSLMLGSACGVLISPVHAECLHALTLAREIGIAERLVVAVGIAESLPLGTSTIQAIMVAGSMHHFDVSRAMQEVSRVLDVTGRYAAAEPWRSPGYATGIRVLGKRERDVDCRPLDENRMTGWDRFFESALIVHHGALTRYALLALHKARVPIPSLVARWVMRIDDALSGRLGLRRFGSSVACLASKPLTGPPQAATTSR